MLNLAKKKIFITGADGFIGSHLTKRLLEEDAKVSILINQKTHDNTDVVLDIKNKDRLDKIFTGDLRNKEYIEKILANTKIDIIYHLAAIGSVPCSKKHPIKIFDVNFGGTLNLLEAVKDSDIEKFVYISSAEIYDGSDIPINEEQKILPDSPYAISKAMADFLVSSYHKTYQVPVFIMRPFNIYGPKNYKNVIFKFIQSSLRHENLNIEGGNQIKNFTYIEDFIKALLLIGCGKDISPGEVFNVGCPHPITIKELAEKIIALTDSRSKIVISNRRKIESKNFVCDCKKIEKLLGWEHKTSLKQGLKQTAEYIKLEKGYKYD